MASVGALLDHLLRNRASSDLDDEGMTGLEIRDIEILALWVFPALYIFKPNDHLSGTKSCKSMRMHLCQYIHDISKRMDIQGITQIPPGIRK
jgi:hypothetical protein